jgi:hypothetical protein
MDYPWYEAVDGDSILQGDFLPKCPILIPESEIPKDEVGGKMKGKLLEYDVIVMSQSCDLEQKNIDLVLVCPHWSLQQVGDARDYFKSSKGKEDLRRGNIPGYHMVAPCDLDGIKHDVRVVDFRAVYSVPFEFIRQFAKAGGKRARLLPPYREHLSQAFARFFMRVGLPVNIPAFK